MSISFDAKAFEGDLTPFGSMDMRAARTFCTGMIEALW